MSTRSDSKEHQHDIMELLQKILQFVTAAALGLTLWIARGALNELAGLEVRVSEVEKKQAVSDALILWEHQVREKERAK